MHRRLVRLRLQLQTKNDFLQAQQWNALQKRTHVGADDSRLQLEECVHFLGSACTGVRAGSSMPCDAPPVLVSGVSLVVLSEGFTAALKPDPPS